MYACSGCGSSHEYADQVADCQRQARYNAERDKGASPQEAHAKTKR